MLTPSEETEYNNKHSPEILKRMGWSYYNTESAARQVAIFADKEIATLQQLAKESFNELKTLSAGESCDHEVGVCWCRTFQLMEKLKTYVNP